jgi:ribonuclease T1
MRLVRPSWIAIGWLGASALAASSCTEHENWSDEVSGGSAVGYGEIELPGLAAIEDGAEAHAVLDTIGVVRARGPFPHPEDGEVFANDGAVLADKPAGYWRAYTVPTPGVKGRGQRRLVAGQGGEYYYFRFAFRDPIAVHAPP